MIRERAKENTSGQMARNIKGFSNKIKEQDMENLSTQMETHLR